MQLFGLLGYIILFCLYVPYSIGYAIARRLALDGVLVMISRRNQQNVQQAVDKLNEESQGCIIPVATWQDMSDMCLILRLMSQHGIRLCMCVYVC